MRLIDATSFKNELFKAVRESQANDMDAITSGLNTAIGMLNAAPTIHTKLIKYYDSSESVWKVGEVIVKEDE